MLNFFPVFTNRDIHVRISDKGHRILNDSKLAIKLANSILNNKEKLQQGLVVGVDKEEKISVEFVTTIKDAKL